MQQAICVYSSSSDAIAPAFFEAATELGAEMARRGHALVFGGTSVGLMGAVARAVHASGGTVIGVIPQSIHERGIAYEIADELIVTRDLRERKAYMEARAEAFVTLPGGFGTLEELLEILTLKQLQAHDKPIALINAQGFYDPLAHLFEHIYRERFARPEYRNLYHFAPDAVGALDYIANYTPVRLESKWSQAELSPGS
ncbi:MAG TPA: TIGR00730 family Rossman fold protein [Chthonomonadaceae bacterium]|nr:TIGR00730 family Rossman fold protein [Chthonomonadaceae bacterium]